MLNARYTKHDFQPAYTEILNTLQKHQNEEYWKMNQQQEISPDEKRSQMTPYVMKFLRDRAFSLPQYQTQELAEKLVNDIEFYSVLTAPLEDPDVEGIHINSFEDVQVDFRNGSSCKIDGFQSQQHAIDIIRRLLQQKNVTMDQAIPMAEASIGSDIRITALQDPVVDKEAGACCYIRKLSRRIFTKEDYLTGDFASEAELNTMQIALKRGVSILIVGKVNTGKTTFLSYLLSNLPENLKVITIESGAREINLIQRDDSNCVKSNAVHLLTRHSSMEQQNITQEKLVEKVLRLNADVMAVAEMRNEEAYAAQEASLVGTAVISTTHAGSPQLAHKRVAELCRKRYPTDMHTALLQACEAFPLVAFIHTPSDGRRRIMNLTECVVQNEQPVYRTLFEFQMSKAGSFGKHIPVHSISDTLIDHMKMFGLTQEELQCLKRKGDES